jgi:hypothetical protein
MSSAPVGLQRGVNNPNQYARKGYNIGDNHVLQINKRYNHKGGKKDEIK